MVEETQEETGVSTETEETLPETTTTDSTDTSELDALKAKVEMLEKQSRDFQAEKDRIRTEKEKLEKQLKEKDYGDLDEKERIQRDLEDTKEELDAVKLERQQMALENKKLEAIASFPNEHRELVKDLLSATTVENLDSAVEKIKESLSKLPTTSQSGGNAKIIPEKDEYQQAKDDHNVSKLTHIIAERLHKNTG